MKQDVAKAESSLAEIKHKFDLFKENETMDAYFKKFKIETSDSKREELIRGVEEFINEGK